ncbi:hypothetical protein AVEN_69232-1 [Araneus ventricosus]|uniref:Gustatory receptor n=1 Tax=Araneus ventricosus TaxID=182803 RepID=A0A4Y2EQ68_ARAVE|nr:hypothetical protein AVEN_69232-1 [Araneus ventricosus]
MSFISDDDSLSSFNIDLGYSLSSTFSLAALLIMRCKKKQLTTLLHSLQETPFCLGSWKMNAGSFIIAAAGPVYASISMIFFNTSDKQKLGAFYTYGQEVENSILRNVITLLKTIPMNFLFHTFANLLTLLYCDLCCHCCVLLRNLTKEITECSPEAFTYPKQIALLKKRKRIMGYLEDMQNYFSSITFLICVANFVICFSSLASYLWNSATISNVFAKVDVFYTTFNCLIVLSAIFLVAGQVPVEAENFVDAFRKKLECRLFHESSPEVNVPIQEWLFVKPDFVLSGCKMINYKRSSILTAFGTILTYGLLIVNMEVRKKTS